MSVTSLGQAAGSDTIRRSWPWLLVGLGFFFLSFDEQFEIHETVRETVLKPHDVLTSVPGLKPGDVILPLYAVAGIWLTWVLLEDLSKPVVRDDVPMDLVAKVLERLMEAGRSQSP